MCSSLFDKDKAPVREQRLELARPSRYILGFVILKLSLLKRDFMSSTNLSCELICDSMLKRVLPLPCPPPLAYSCDLCVGTHIYQYQQHCLAIDTENAY